MHCSSNVLQIMLYIIFILLLELDLIRRDVQSRIWCTYRKGFPPLGRAQLTSDRGWGCTLRCGQMLIGQALLDLHLGRDWFWTSEIRYTYKLHKGCSTNAITTNIFFFAEIQRI